MPYFGFVNIAKSSDVLLTCIRLINEKYYLTKNDYNEFKKYSQLYIY